MAASGIDISIFSMVLDKGDRAARLTLAIELGGLVTHGLATAEELNAVQPVLERLAADPVRAIREEVAEMLVGALSLSDGVVFTIMADELDIAGPFLAQARALRGGKLLSALRLGDGERQAILAGRDDLSPEAVQFIASQGAASAALSLLMNEYVALSQQDYKYLAQRFADDAEICEALLQHQSVPAVARARLAGQMAQRLSEGLMDSPLLPANRMRDVLLEARENALAQLALNSPAEEWDEMAQYLLSRDELTPSLMVRLSALGAMGFARLALSLVGRVSRKASVRRLIKAAGLPEMAGIIVSEALQLAEQAEAPGQGFCHRLIERLALGPNSEAVKVELLVLLGEAADHQAKQMAADLALRMRHPQAA